MEVSKNVTACTLVKGRAFLANFIELFTKTYILISAKKCSPFTYAIDVLLKGGERL